MKKGFEQPQGLSPEGQTAYKVVYAFLAEHDLLESGGGTVFWHPKAWSERGERYGASSVLVITHDGGDHADAFDWDRENFNLLDALNQTLAAQGLFVEQCTSWYSAIYKL